MPVSLAVRCPCLSTRPHRLLDLVNPCPRQPSAARDSVNVLTESSPSTSIKPGSRRLGGSPVEASHEPHRAVPRSSRPTANLSTYCRTCADLVYLLRTGPMRIHSLERDTARARHPVCPDTDPSPRPGKPLLDSIEHRRSVHEHSRTTPGTCRHTGATLRCMGDASRVISTRTLGSILMKASDRAMELIQQGKRTRKHRSSALKHRVVTPVALRAHEKVGTHSFRVPGVGLR